MIVSFVFWFILSFHDDFPKVEYIEMEPIEFVATLEK